MKQLLFAAAILAGVSLFAAEKTPAVTPFAAGERATFLGDSITHGGLYHVNLQLFWDLRFPGSGTRLMNCGVSGGTAGGGAARWKHDVLPQRADRVFVMFGMNDVGHGNYETVRWKHDVVPPRTGQDLVMPQPAPKVDEKTAAKRKASLDAYRKNMAQIADDVQAAGKKLVVITPTPYDEYGDSYTPLRRMGCNSQGLASFAEACRALAAERKAELLDLYAPLTDFIRVQRDYTFCRKGDRVHPTPDGHVIVTALMLEAMGVSPVVAKVELDAEGHVGGTVRAKVSDVKASLRALSFRYAPATLPFPASDDYRKADAVFPVSEKMNMEVLKVSGLPSGAYDLAADGKTLGTFSSGQFAEGVNLALLPTPEAKLAMDAWKISRELVSVQARQRTLVLIESAAARRGANPGDFADVCAKMEAFVGNLKKNGSSTANYYSGQLAAYRRDKAQIDQLRTQEDACRRRLAEAAAKKVSYVLEIRPDDGIVTASSFGWNPTNATKCLQAALDSGASKVVVDRQASAWLVDMVYPRSNTEIVFADGVVVCARPGSMIRTVDNLFRCKGVTNLTLRGEGRAVLKMRRADYLDKTRYRHGEHRHAVSLHNAENVVVRDLTIEDSGGDGVYVLNVKHGLLENLRCTGHARQGTSIISADDVTIRNCVFARTKGALPECGMDIEPGHSRFNIQRVLIENCVMCSNNCSGVAINVSGLKDTNKAMDVTYRNCRLFDNASRGLWLVLSRGTWAPVKGNLRFEHCVMSGNGDGPLQINNLASDALRVSFKDCLFDAAGMRSGRGAPISLVNGSIRDDLNNLSFDGCRLVNCPKGQPVTFGAMTGCGVLPDGAKGVLDIAYASGAKGTFDFSSLAAKHPPKPELRTFETGSVDLRRLAPLNAEGKASGISNPAGYRGPFTFLQHVRTPGEYVIHFKSTQIGKYANIAIAVDVFDINGTPHDTFVVTQPDFDYVLKAQASNSIYRFVVKPNGRRVSLTSSLAGQGFVANDRIHWLEGRDVNVYFQAKVGAGDVKVELTMSPGEWVSAELVDPSGRVVDACKERSEGVVLIGRRAKDAPSEIWKLHVTRFVDDCRIRFGAATSGVYAHDRELLLVEK